MSAKHITDGLEARDRRIPMLNYARRRQKMSGAVNLILGNVRQSGN